MACRYSLSAAENSFCAKYRFPFSTCSRARAELRQAGRTASMAARRRNKRLAVLPTEERLQRNRIILFSESEWKPQRLDFNSEAGRNASRVLGLAALEIKVAPGKGHPPL